MDWQYIINLFANCFIFLFFIQYILSFFKTSRKDLLTKMLINCLVISAIVILSIPVLKECDIRLGYLIEFPFEN
ncbi:hypothetical protein [Rummeliibacillus pycnus]|uniref:hypothetical protein n=1 Tax=Rummeliibacillus pycnus TaxID=101070 RepID=UPI0037C61183